MRTTTGSYAEIWARVLTGRPRAVQRPGPAPRPESVDEVAAWAGSEDFRRTQFIHAPVFWVALPVVALGFLIWGIVTDPADGQPWNFWLVWVAVGVWLLVAVGVLLLRQSVWRDLGVENQWILQRGIAHSIHRASVDYDDGEAGGWATYIALDHRLEDRHAARIHEAFEQWLRLPGLPSSGSGPISSESLFGSAATGGYYFLHLPVSQTAGEDTEHQWLLITEPRDGDDDEVIVTPVPVRKQLTKIRAKLRRRAEKRSR